MISRLVLNLRSVPTEDDSGSSGLHMQRGISDRSFMTRTIGNLGEDMFDTVVAGPREDKLELPVEIPLVNISKYSEITIQ
jgi:hypothetical protein